jgi:hypothetical protein
MRKVVVRSQNSKVLNSTHGLLQFSHRTKQMTTRDGCCFSGFGRFILAASIQVASLAPVLAGALIFQAQLY